MFTAFFSLAGKRGRWLVTLVGLASFAASFSALIVFATGWAAAVIPTISETVLNATLSAVVAQFAMSLTSAVLIRHLRREIEQMHTAIESMAQGLCMSMRRFTRLTNAFSKKLENLQAAVALHFAHYNLVRVHKTLRVTPAMAANVTDRLWSLKELVDRTSK